MTLAETSAKILSNTPESAKLVQLINQQLTRTSADIDPNVVNALVDTGFNKQQVLKALKRRR